MENQKVYIGAKIHWDNHSATLDESIRKVDSKDPNAINYENGMTDFRFVEFVENEQSGKIKRKILSEDSEVYFFGEFISLADLKSINVNGKWDNAIYNIKQSDGIGMVTSPNGFHLLMPENGVMVNELSQTKKR